MSAPPVVALSSEPEAIEETARFVVVAWDVVAFSAVKFWSVVEPVARMFDAVRPALNVCAPVKVFAVYVFGIVVEDETK